MITVVSSVIILGIFGVLFGACLAYLSVVFAVQVDPRIEKITEILPGANCGGCGAPGCFSFAEGVVSGALTPTSCAPGGKEVAAKISAILGCEVGEMIPMVAVANCQGGNQEARQKFEYMGVEDCRAALLLSGGHKACGYGCLGFGNCVAVCQFHAIMMNDNGLPVVNPHLCTGCGLCVGACPRHVISLISKDQKIYVGCVNPEKGKSVKAVCTVGCLGCGVCANKNNNPSGDIVMEKGLPIITYESNLRVLPGAARCPSKAYVINVKYPAVEYDGTMCDGCEDKAKPLCVKICPVKECLVYDGENKKAVYDSSFCVGCKLCLEECPVKAFK
ncbi:MAG: RnfABCDGE type electron transport complex subunit B [Syntrophobacterales bacterium]|jgi:RnfABCDGE-type electron transport complex B subunit|nr:RnfABCDGE type electron transport complex subunit B [Syntrophobacterales bacterium]